MDINGTDLPVWVDFVVVFGVIFIVYIITKLQKYGNKEM